LVGAFALLDEAPAADDEPVLLAVVIVDMPDEVPLDVEFELVLEAEPDSGLDGAALLATFAALAMKAWRVLGPVVGGLMTPTMPFSQCFACEQ